jgi:hypothetical protein
LKLKIHVNSTKVMRKLSKINWARLRDGARVRFGGGGGGYSSKCNKYWEEIMFCNDHVCSAGESTVTDNKFCTISEPKNSNLLCVIV